MDNREELTKQVKQTPLKYPPEVIMAELMYKKLRLEITPEAMKKFVCDNWDMLSMLAHRIHDNGK